MDALGPAPMSTDTSQLLGTTTAETMAIFSALHHLAITVSDKTTAIVAAHALHQITIVEGTTDIAAIVRGGMLTTIYHFLTAHHKMFQTSKSSFWTRASTAISSLGSNQPSQPAVCVSASCVLPRTYPSKLSFAARLSKES